MLGEGKSGCGFFLKKKRPTRAVVMYNRYYWIDLFQRLFAKTAVVR
jgi:hypothetical protein